MASLTDPASAAEPDPRRSPRPVGRPPHDDGDRAAAPRVVYFCMEYGLDASLPVYSGGLGVLAGDYMKSAGDLNRPILGIGLLWREGYTVQHIDPAGKPVDRYPPTPTDALSLLDVRVEVTVEGAPIVCQAWRVDAFTTAELYLLEPVRQADRWITRRLYGGDERDRLAQEIVLGVGGVRLVRALGRDVDVYHFNEGHAVFAGLELVREGCEAGMPFADAVAAVRDRIVFTTHTPVAAGNEIHPVAAMRAVGADLGFGDDELDALGGEPFSMTAAGLRLSRAANAVAELHGETARAMWREVTEAAPPALPAASIIAITNGVHAPTWQDARIRAALDEADASARETALWQAHTELKAELLALIEQRTGARFAPDRLLCGFARRAATYKRADLMFSSPERFEALSEGARLQLVFSGKAHPRDADGKRTIERIVAASRRWPDRVVLLENYDMRLGAALTRGCDVWLNNPRRPLEASGTSGMKAAMNGVLNVSILDGWWPEGCEHGRTGWRIGDAPPAPGDRDGIRARAAGSADGDAPADPLVAPADDPVVLAAALTATTADATVTRTVAKTAVARAVARAEEAVARAEEAAARAERARMQAEDERDARAIHRVFADEVLPRYYKERSAWIEMMQASVAMSQWRFSSDRMLEDYYRHLYTR